MDPSRSQPQVPSPRTAADRRRDGAPAGTSPQRRGVSTPIAEEFDRRRDNRRHAIAMKCTHARQPAG